MDKDRCPHMDGCEMYGLFQLKGALRVWQINYCEGKYERCARYQLSCDGEKMPRDLLPNGKRIPLQYVEEKK